LFHSWCAAASLVKRRPQVPLPVVRKRCRRRHLTTVQKAASISRLELRLIGGPLTERCHSRRQQLLRLNIRPASQSRLLQNRRHLRPIHGPAFTSGLGPALVVPNHKTGKPPRGAPRPDIGLLRRVQDCWHRGVGSSIAQVCIGRRLIGRNRRGDWVATKRSPPAAPQPQSAVPIKLAGLTISRNCAS
jgi:hypothetical protein